MPAVSGGVDELRRESQHPTGRPSRDQRRLRARQQLLDVTVGQPVPGYHRTATATTSRGKR
jgi:hypothetical protein